VLNTTNFSKIFGFFVEIKLTNSFKICNLQDPNGVSKIPAVVLIDGFYGNKLNN
jgi:hypothetical protein